VVGVFVVARVVRFVKRVELTMFNHWTKALKRERTDIETDLDVELEWERLPEKQASLSNRHNFPDEAGDLCHRQPNLPASTPLI
jgi:hypothetical protein